MTRGLVLVAIDFSRHAESALLWALEESALRQVPLTVLHVVHDPGDQPGYYRKVLEDAGRSTPAEEMPPMEQSAAAALECCLDMFAAKHPKLQLDAVERRLAIGLPASRIIEEAGSLGAQLIVVGSHGRTGLDHILLGSVAERVARLSPVPVLIVKQATSEVDA